MKTSLTIDLGDFAAGSVESLASAIEATLLELAELAEAAGPGATRDDASFQQFREQILDSLHALRGRGLLLSDEQAQRARHLWWAAYEFITPIQEECSSDWTRALQELDEVLPRLEAGDG